MSNDANVYAKMGVQTGVMSASPHKLIVMLFDGALTSVRLARLHMECGNVTEKCEAIAKAVDIIQNGLWASLDMEQGGEVAQGLEQLYDRMVTQLINANLRNEPQLLDEVEGLLDNIASAWREIAPQAAGEGA